MVLAYHLWWKKLAFLEEIANSRLGAENEQYKSGSSCLFAGNTGTELNVSAAAAAAKSLQSCLTLCNPTDGSLPGSPIPVILQARTLEWVAIYSSNAWKWKVKVKSLSHARLFSTPWTAAHKAPPSMGFSRQEYWSGVPLPSPECECTVNEIQTGKLDRSMSCVISFFGGVTFLKCIYFNWGLLTLQYCGGFGHT